MWEKCYYSEMHLTQSSTGISILSSGRKVQMLPCWFVVLKLFNLGYSSNFVWIRNGFYLGCLFVCCNRMLSMTMIAFVLEQNMTLWFFCRILYRFGFHQPPLNSVNHLHLHCLALPYTPRYESFWLLYVLYVRLSLSWMLCEYLKMPFHEFKQMEMYEVFAFWSNWFHWSREVSWKDKAYARSSFKSIN